MGGGRMTGSGRGEVRGCAGVGAVRRAHISSRPGICRPWAAQGWMELASWQMRQGCASAPMGSPPWRSWWTAFKPANASVVAKHAHATMRRRRLRAESPRFDRFPCIPTNWRK